MLERLRSTFFYICWLPLGLYVLSDIYITNSLGWGQWAISVVVLPPMLLSAAFLLAGAFLFTDTLAKNEPALKIFLATVVAGSVFVWFVARSIWVDFFP